METAVVVFFILTILMLPGKGTPAQELAFLCQCPASHKCLVASIVVRLKIGLFPFRNAKHRHLVGS